MVTYKINRNEIAEDIIKLLGKGKAKARVYDKAYSFFYRAKSVMLKEFNQSNVTNEIENGPLAVNISDTLDGYGNLFSFIGFENGSDPIGPLRELLESTEFQSSVYRNGKYYFKIFAPSKSDVKEVTQMPWEPGNSWALEMETGISGLSNYMYKHWSGGRSQEGFQLPYENQDDLVFKPTPYITKILNNFRDRIQNGKS